MSELTNTWNKSNVKWQLLASVSAITLAGLSPTVALASDDNRPTVWIELGGQLERLTDGQDPYAPPFVSQLSGNWFTPPSEVQRPPRYSFGQEGRISFNPEGSDWVFSVGLRYGRSNRDAKAHDEDTVHVTGHAIQSIPFLGKYITGDAPHTGQRLATTTSQNHDSHLVLDFMAGKDVGLGVLGTQGISILNAGVRFAQFTSHSKARIDAVPNFVISYTTKYELAGQPVYLKAPFGAWSVYAGKFEAARSFTGLGPSLSWDANATLLGAADSTAITVDWGLNGALLFGRQKMSAHQTTTAHHTNDGPHPSQTQPVPTLYPTKVHDTARSRSVVVPNVGGFAGMSLRFPNAKVSLGYRADFFFGAMDGGIDVRKTYDRGFYGPFATISIGLGG